MKKAKILLTAITVVAVAGGALAFKVQKLNVKYCLGPAVEGVCPTGFEGQIDPNAPTTAFVETLNIDRCDDDQPICTSVARIGGE